jgi:hypothetical protein
MEKDMSFLKENIVGIILMKRERNILLDLSLNENGLVKSKENFNQS